jgi:hypothetical protein
MSAATTRKEVVMDRLARLVQPLRRPLALAVLSAVVALGILTAGAGQASAGVDTQGIYRITSYWTSLALDVQGGSLANEAAVIQWGVNGGRNQEWRFVAVGNAYEIVNYNSGKCLTVQGNVATAGARLVQYGCAGASNQLWWVMIGSIGDVSIQSVLSGLYVDVPGGSVTWGTQLIQWYGSSGGSLNQAFRLTLLA